MKTYKLEKSIQHKGVFKNKVVEIITIKLPKVKDLYGLDFTDQKNLNEIMAVLICRCSSLSKQQVDNLDLYDFHRICEILNDYMLRKQQ